MKTISLLIERKLDFTPDKIVAASRDRKLLIERAQERCLSIDAHRLDRTNNAKIDEFTQATIEEIEVLKPPEDEHQRITDGTLIIL